MIEILRIAITRRTKEGKAEKPLIKFKDAQEMEESRKYIALVIDKEIKRSAPDEEIEVLFITKTE